MKNIIKKKQTNESQEPSFSSLCPKTSIFDKEKGSGKVGILEATKKKDRKK